VIDGLTSVMAAFKKIAQKLFGQLKYPLLQKYGNYNITYVKHQGKFQGKLNLISLLVVEPFSATILGLTAF
jgi:hypothetical protein